MSKMTQKQDRSRSARWLMAGCTAVTLGAGLAVVELPKIAQAKEMKNVVIGLSMKTRAQRRWTLDEAQMQAEADKLGVKLIFQWANDSPTEQTAQFENLLSQNVDAMIIVPVDAAAAAKLVDEAHQQHVPVISYDVDVPGARLDFKVTRDNYQVGVVQAHAALKFAPKGVYALVKGDPANNVAHALSDAYEKELGADKDIKIVYNQFTANWDPKAAQSVAENVLSANADKVDAFVTSNDGMATGVAQAIEGRNLQGKVFISGLDAETPALRLIADGVQTMTVWSDLANSRQGRGRRGGRSRPRQDAGHEDCHRRRWSGILSGLSGRGHRDQQGQPLRVRDQACAEGLDERQGGLAGQSQRLQIGRALPRPRRALWLPTQPEVRRLS